MGTFTEYAGKAGGETLVSSNGYMWVWAVTDNKISRYDTAGSKTDYTPGGDLGDSYGACVGPDSRVWFSDYTNNKLVAITTGGSPTITEYTTGFSGKGPCGLASDGTDLFVACLTTDQILKVTASTGAVAATYSGTAGSGIFQICHSSGVLYFTCNSSHHVQKFTISGASFSSRVSTKTASGGPYGITIGPDGNLWYVEEAVDKVAKISTDLSTTHLDYATGVTSSDPRFIAADSSSLWVTDYGGKKLLQVATNGTVTQHSFPSTRSPNDKPVFVAVASNGHVWVTAPEAGAYIYDFESVAAISASDTFSFSEGSSSVDNGTKSASDTIGFSDSATLGVTRVIDSVSLPSSTPPSQTGSRVTITDDSAYNAFPGFVVADNGDKLAFITAGSAHDSSDQVVKMQRFDSSGAAGSPVTVSAGTYRCKHGFATKLRDGSIVLTYLEINAATGIQRCWSRKSTDHGTTWGTPKRIPTLGTYWTDGTNGNMGGAICCPPVEHPSTDGELLVALHAINSGQDPTYCYVHLARSTDAGDSWSTYTTVFAYDGVTDGFEPWLIQFRKPGGAYELQCYIRSEISSGGYKVRRAVATSPSGASFGALTTPITGLTQNTMPGVWQNPDGSLDIQTRETLVGSNYAATFRHSTDGGVTFGSANTIDSSGGEVYGQSQLVRPGIVGRVYALDKGPNTPTPNVANTNADVYYQEFVAAYPAREVFTLTEGSATVSGTGATAKTASDTFTVTDTAGVPYVFSTIAATEAVSVADAASLTSVDTPTASDAIVFIEALVQVFEVEGTSFTIHPQGMVPGTAIGAYLRWEWKGPVAAKLNAGPGAVVRETTVADDLTATFVSLDPGEYVAYAPAYPTKRLFFMVTE